MSPNGVLQPRIVWAEHGTIPFQSLIVGERMELCKAVQRAKRSWTMQWALEGYNRRKRRAPPVTWLIHHSRACRGWSFGAGAGMANGNTIRCGWSYIPITSLLYLELNKGNITQDKKQDPCSKGLIVYI